MHLWPTSLDLKTATTKAKAQIPGTSQQADLGHVWYCVELPPPQGALPRSLIFQQRQNNASDALRTMHRKTTRLLRWKHYPIPAYNGTEDLRRRAHVTRDCRQQQAQEHSLHYTKANPPKWTLHLTHHTRSSASNWPDVEFQHCNSTCIDTPQLHGSQRARSSNGNAQPPAKLSG